MTASSPAGRLPLAPVQVAISHIDVGGGVHDAVVAILPDHNAIGMRGKSHIARLVGDGSVVHGRPLPVRGDALRPRPRCKGVHPARVYDTIARAQLNKDAVVELAYPKKLRGKTANAVASAEARNI